MDASTPMPADLQRQQDRKRKRKAILAGGVVLGLGAAVTLAAWSDDVFANGTFNTGSFNLEGSADGENWAEHETTGAAAPLSFTINALQMSPDETVYAPFSIRTDEDTSLPGEVTLIETTANGPYAGLLTYKIFNTGDTHGAGCNASNPSGLTDTWADSTDAGSVPTAPTAPIAIGAATTAPAHLCIAVTLSGQDDVEAATGTGNTTVTWEFNGLSTDAVATTP